MHRTLSRLTTCFVSLLMTAGVLASPGPIETAPVPGIGNLPYQRLFEAYSEPGESVDGFMARVAPQLRAWSDETRLEACGAIATDGQRLGIVVGTSLSHLGCAIYSFKVPAGMRATGEGIHSHGGKDRFQMNQSDRMLQGVPDDVRSQRTRGMVYGQNLGAFSELDLHGAPGYLATPTGLIHHNGQGQIRTVR